MRHSFKYRKYLKDMRYALMRRLLLFVLAKRRVNILAQLSEMIETSNFNVVKKILVKVRRRMRG